MTSNYQREIKCDMCGVLFWCGSPSTRFCSNRCRTAFCRFSARARDGRRRPSDETLVPFIFRTPPIPGMES